MRADECKNNQLVTDQAVQRSDISVDIHTPIPSKRSLQRMYSQLWSGRVVQKKPQTSIKLRLKFWW